MKKPGIDNFDVFAEKFKHASKQAGKPKQFLRKQHIKSTVQVENTKPKVKEKNKKVKTYLNCNSNNSTKDSSLSKASHNKRNSLTKKKVKRSK